MAFLLDRIFTTRTALPKNGGIVEVEPIAALKPYIRCFWTVDNTNSHKSARIIPDCCADILIDIDNRSASFVGISLDSFLTEHTSEVFGIRFYAWTVSRFVRVDADKLNDADIAPENLFCDFAKFKDGIIRAENTAKRIELAENYLLRLIDERQDDDVMNCLYSVIVHNGNKSVGDLADEIAVSKRTLERKFLRNVGVSPKIAAELIRYQLLWQDCIAGGFDIFDEVDKFGYYDQAHMYNDFKKYHGITIGDARNEYLDLSRFYNTIQS